MPVLVGLLELSYGHSEIMVKFQKQLAGQLEQNWKYAYCNYKELKREINSIKRYLNGQLASNLVANSAGNETYCVTSFKSLGNPTEPVSFLRGLVNNPAYILGNAEDVVVCNFQTTFSII